MNTGKIMRHVLAATAIGIGLGALAAVPAAAQFGLPNPFSGQASPSAGPNMESSDNLNRELSGLNGRFALAMREMLTAQSYTLIALGDKAKADQLSSEAKSLEGANDINTVSRCISDSEDASQEINAKMAASATIDANAKQNLALATPHYAVGTIQAAHLPAEYQAWLTNAKATVNGMSHNPMGMVGGGLGLSRSVSDVVDVTAHLPGLITAWSDTTHNFVKFAQGNKVDTSDLAAKI